MKAREHYTLQKALKLISPESGIINFMGQTTYLHSDPTFPNWGILPCNTSCYGPEQYSGRSGGNGTVWYEAVLATIGEVVERYCPAFYDLEKFTRRSYRTLDKNAISPEQVALFHGKQYSSEGFYFKPFTKNSELYWSSCYNLITGEEVMYPASLIYFPWHVDEDRIGLSTSTGLAGHIDYHEAILTGLYELIERDAFMISWMQQLDIPKMRISSDIREYLNKFFPEHYEFHFFDITLDLSVPTTFGICFGEEEFGKFVAVGSATRNTYGNSLKKVIKEIGQTVPYFRYFLEKKQNWNPKDFTELRSFEDHSLFYLKKKEYLSVFDRFVESVPSKDITFHTYDETNTQKEIISILKIFDDKNYDVLLANLTTSDIRESGFCSIKVLCPQLIQMNGHYRYYFSGGERLYDVPANLGYKGQSYDELNKYPHPFP